MNSDFENNLRETLTNAVPEAPAAPNRAEQARARAARATRRRAGVIATGAAALAVAAIAIGPSLVDTGSGRDAEPDNPQPAGSAASPYDGFQCGVTPQASQLRSEITEGAVRARICPVVPEAEGVGWQPPADALVSSAALDELAHLVGGLETADPLGACTMELGPAYTLTFEYADGRLATVTGELYGCRPVTVGGQTFLGAVEVKDAYFEALLQQRATMTPPPVQAAPACDTQGFGPQGSLLPLDGSIRFVKVAACEYNLTGALIGSGVLIDAEVAEFNRQFAATLLQPSEGGPTVTCAMSERDLRLVAISTWGDPVTATQSGMGCWWASEAFFRLDESMTAAVDAAVAD
jgi:hypothetical protein